MDPDHVPQPYFLTRTIGYFRDPDVAFVVAPQVYGNQTKAGLRTEPATRRMSSMASCNAAGTAWAHRC